MMLKQITQTIQELLMEHNYVTIPQLGGFVSMYQPAQIIADKNIILPPSKKISFNADLKNDDGLLVNAFARQENISTLKAEKSIMAFVEKAFISLDEGKKIVLDKIGTLRFNQQLNIEFEAVVTENYNPYSYGMIDVACQVLTQNELVEKENKQIFTRRNLKRVAVILPFIVVGTILSVYLNHLGVFSTINQQQATVIPITIDKNNKTVASEENGTIEEQIDFKTNKKNALSYTEPVEEVAVNPNASEMEQAVPEVIEEGFIVEKDIPVEIKEEKEVIAKPEVKLEISLKYQLVAGSFISEANANRLSKKIQKLDLQPEVVKQGDRYRVIASSFSKKSDAVKAKKSLKAKKISTWVNTLK